MSYFGWAPYVPVAKRRAQGARKLRELRKKGEVIAPVVIEGRIIAKSFWGQSWCTNLERYSDFASRLPRGRTYVRNGSVLDLRIAKGEVVARVAGSDLYTVKATIAPVKPPRWKAICRDCTGTIDSLVELLQGRLAKGVMDRVCRAGDGLFPAPDEIKLSCSCPDWADMCKHVAAVLYGVGARLDQSPQLLFVLRGVDENELLAGTGPNLPLAKGAHAQATVLEDSDMAALFGLEMAEEGGAGVPVRNAKSGREVLAKKPGKSPKRTKSPTVKNAKAPRRKPVETVPAPEFPVHGGKRARRQLQRSA
jgi:uncharacterized Zn finger protein